MSNKIYGIGDEEELAEDLQKELFELKHNPNIIEIPDNATNGDMIKALFPKLNVSETKTIVAIYDGELNYKNIKIQTDYDWWNAPYKKGESE